jgi:hypothetical protein
MRGFGRKTLFVLAAVLGTVLGGNLAVAGDESGLLEAIQKADDGTGDVKEIAKKLVTAVKGASPEVHEAATEKIREEYNMAKMAMEDDKAAQIARWAMIFCLAAKEGKNTTLFANVRMILWQDLFDIAGSATMDVQEKVDETVKLAKWWEPLWDGLFEQVMKTHGQEEAKGNTATMKQYQEQMEIMAKAKEKAFGKKDLLETYETFMKALESLKDLTPQQREIKMQADKGYKLAKHRYEGKEYNPAKSILETNVIPKYEKIGDLRGVMKAKYLLAEVYLELKQPWKIKELLDEIIKIAEKLGDEGFKAQCQEFLQKLKTEGVDLTKNPFTTAKNLGDEEKIKLKPAYGQVRESRPLPHSWENHYFWRPTDLQRGVNKDGKPNDVFKLPFPQPAQFFLIWTQKGRDVIIAKDEKGVGPTPFKYGIFSANKVKVTMLYFDYEKNKNVPMPYEMLAIENRKVTIAGNERTFDPANSPNYIGLRIHSNTYRQGKVGGQRLLILDDNTNAMFIDQGTLETGDANNDHKFYGCDSFVVGSGRSAYSTLYGGLIKVKDKYYFIKEADVGGMMMTVQEYKGPMGKLEVKGNWGRGVTPLHFVVGTSVGSKRLGFINLGGEKGPVAVPTGSYFFKWGVLCRGKDPNKDDRVEIWKGTTKRFKLEEGKTVAIEMGGPYKIEMPVVVSGNMGELQTYKLKVFGKGGEEYKRFWHKPFLPAYKVVDAGGASVKAGKLRAFTEQDELEPPGGGIDLLEFAKRVLFKIPGGRKPPLKATFTDKHPLLGNIQTK